jgi:hypothetical protein
VVRLDLSTTHKGTAEKETGGDAGDGDAEDREPEGGQRRSARDRTPETERGGGTGRTQDGEADAPRRTHSEEAEERHTRETQVLVWFLEVHTLRFDRIVDNP